MISMFFSLSDMYLVTTVLNISVLCYKVMTVLGAATIVLVPRTTGYRFH